MRTDKEIFKIFQQWPALVASLAGLDDDGPCTMESVTVKALARSMDGLVRPEDTSRPLTVVETQFQRDERIYNRTVTEMSAVQEDNGQRAVRGVIFFSSSEIDPKTTPWTAVVTSVDLGAALAAREALDSSDPAVAVFKPVFEPDAGQLEKNAGKYYSQIKPGDTLTPAQARTLADVFVHWLLERLDHLDETDIAMILDLPDIEDTRAGRSLINRGIERGEEQGVENSIIAVAQKRFGADSITGQLEAAIRALPVETLNPLLMELLDLPDCATFARRVAELS